MKAKTHALRKKISDKLHFMEDKQRKTLLELTKVVELSHSKLPYHNFAHGLDVWDTALEYALHYGLSLEDIYLVQTAAILHDSIVEVGKTDNEERSAEYGQLILPEFSYSDKQIDVVSELIMDTKLDFSIKGLTSPKTLLGEIICDSDLDNLGRPDFFYNSLLLSKETERPLDYQGLLGFLKATKYWTDRAKELREEGKQENMQRLEVLLDSYRMKDTA